MKEGGCLIVIFLLICIESCSSLDYENICQHDFSQGCPVHEGDSWSCAKFLTNCSGDQFNKYHCVLNSTGQPFKVIHTCAPLSQCVKGTIPIYDEREKVISCKSCRDGYYQPLSTWSDEAPVCSKKHKCEGNQIECDMGTGLSNTHDVYCRCDARNNFILTSFERRGKCVEWPHATCYFHPCPDVQERLSNYSCAPLCPQGQKHDDNDICIPIISVNQTASSLNDSLIISGETTPKTTTITTPTSTPMPTTKDSNISTIIASVIAGVLLIIVVLFILFWRRYHSKQSQSVRNSERNRRQRSTDKKYQSVMKPDRHRRQSLEVFWKRYLYTRCLSVMNCGRTRRETPTDTGTEVELTLIIQDPDANVAAENNPSQEARTNEDPDANVAAENNPSQDARTNEDTDADGAAENNSSQGARTNKGTTIIHQNFVFNNPKRVHIGGKNLKTYNFSAELQKTSDDSSSTHSSGSSLADLPNSSQGELLADRNLSSLLNPSEDIELDTQPKQISNGRDSSEIRASCEIHVDMEQTNRKVV